MTKILVGVDGGNRSLKAAQAAARLAKAMNAELHVIAASSQPERVSQDVASGIRVNISTLDEVREGLARAMSHVRDICPQAHDHLLEGRPADVLIDQARRLDVEVIVVGNRRAQGIGRVLGSVASAVVQHAPCDVYVVKTDD
jgi:nucleotide-binding universal stress UspA family protein